MCKHSEYIECRICGRLYPRFNEHVCELEAPTVRISGNSQPFPHIDTRKY